MYDEDKCGILSDVIGGKNVARCGLKSSSKHKNNIIRDAPCLSFVLDMSDTKLNIKIYIITDEFCQKTTVNQLVFLFVLYTYIYFTGSIKRKTLAVQLQI